MMTSQFSIEAELAFMRSRIAGMREKLDALQRSGQSPEIAARIEGVSQSLLCSSDSIARTAERIKQERAAAVAVPA